MLRSLANKLLVPTLTIVILILATWGCLAVTKKAGENLAPLKPRVLVFGATWCPHCPKPEALYKLKKDFPNVNVILKLKDLEGDAADFKKYGIKRLPTFVVCDDKGCKIFYSLTALRGWLTNGGGQ